MIEIRKYQLIMMLEKLKEISTTGTFQEVIDGYDNNLDIDVDDIVFSFEDVDLDELEREEE